MRKYIFVTICGLLALNVAVPSLISTKPMSAARTLVWVDAAGRVVGNAFGDNLAFVYDGRLTVMGMTASRASDPAQQKGTTPPQLIDGFGVPDSTAAQNAYYLSSNCTGAPYLEADNSASSLFGTRKGAASNFDDVLYVTTADVPVTVAIGSIMYIFADGANCYAYQQPVRVYPAVAVPLSSVMTLPLQLQLR